jgi:hypothetical protein
MAMNLLEIARSSAETGESSAKALARYFHEKGISRDAITGSHLVPLYAEARSMHQAARELCLEPPPLESAGGHSSAPVCAVIVETRPHPALEFVVNWFSDRLRVPIQLIHGTGNEAFIRGTTIEALLDQGRVQLDRLNVANLPARSYNALFLNREFWNRMAGRNKILVFQTDALLCAASPFTLADFFHFDYIGSAWSCKRPIGFRINGGCGGLSIRDWKSSVRSLEVFPPEAWPGGEDGYFAFHLDLMGFRVGSADDCARFASQGSFKHKSFGVHKPRSMDRPTLERFIDYCPEVQHIL